MKKLIQTRLHDPGKVKGNCFPTVIACLLDLDNPEEVLQFQELYNKENEGIYWQDELKDWLQKRGWEWTYLKEHLMTGEYYLVTGNTIRSKDVLHICIYKNGKLVHDPHPDQSGLTTEKYFEIIKPIK